MLPAWVIMEISPQKDVCVVPIQESAPRLIRQVVGKVRECLACECVVRAPIACSDVCGFERRKTALRQKGAVSTLHPMSAPGVGKACR